MSGFGGRGGSYGRSRGGEEYSEGGCSYDMFVPAGDCGKIIGTLICSAVTRGPRVNHQCLAGRRAFHVFLKLICFTLATYGVDCWNIGSEMLFLCSRYMSEISECSVCFLLFSRSYLCNWVKSQMTGHFGKSAVSLVFYFCKMFTGGFSSFPFIGCSFITERVILF